MSDCRVERPDEWWIELYKNLRELNGKASGFIDCLEVQFSKGINNFDRPRVSAKLYQLHRLAGGSYWVSFGDEFEKYEKMEYGDQIGEVMLWVGKAASRVLLFVNDSFESISREKNLLMLPVLCRLGFEEDGVKIEEPRGEEIQASLRLALDLLAKVPPVAAYIRDESMGILSEKIVASANQEVRANTSQLFPNGIPENPDVRDLVILLNTESGKPQENRRSNNEIAREFTGETKGSEGKGKSLLAQIRRLKREGDVNL